MTSLHQLTAHSALQKLASKEISSEELVAALIERADRIEVDVNAFVYRRTERAMAEARRWDEARRRGEALPPLAGLPITVKDNIDVEGIDSTLGLSSRRHRPAPTDAVLVRQLRQAGAVIVGKTNVPQLLLAQETENAVFGVTNNPWDKARTPGGSSGGEAAAIAAGISCLGFGTDIGGSIRTPAHFCGLVGVKGTLDRWSNRGSNTSLPGQELVRSQVGPLARSVRDVIAVFRNLDPVAMSRTDPAVPPLPAPDPSTIDVSGLRIGVFDDDGFVTPAPALRRAVREAAASLEAAGAQLVPYRPDSAAEILAVWLGGMSSDGGTSLDLLLDGEEITPQLKPSRRVAGLPGPLRKAAAAVMSRKGEHRAAALLEALGRKPVERFWQLAAERTRLRRAEIDTWNKLGLDAVVCPAHIVPALPHRSSGDFVVSLAIQFRWTLLNFPAGVVPVTMVRKDETRLPGEGEMVERKIAEICKGSAGLPVGAQVVARPYCEDVLLAAMLAVEEDASSRDGYPTAPIDP